MIIIQIQISYRHDYYPNTSLPLQHSDIEGANDTADAQGDKEITFCRSLNGDGNITELDDPIVSCLFFKYETLWDMERDEELCNFKTHCPQKLEAHILSDHPNVMLKCIKKDSTQGGHFPEEGSDPESQVGNSKVRLCKEDLVKETFLQGSPLHQTELHGNKQGEINASNDL